MLLRNGPRVTKADTARGMALAQACDRGFTVNPVVLIAPFRGRGIFEWDRDSLVVGLVPVEGVEDSIANASGNYRMLMDSFQNGSTLRKAYESRFPEVKFQQAFSADYRLWVTQVGHGNAQALTPERVAFFREWIGPDCRTVLAPPGLRNLGPQARETIRKRLEKQAGMGQQDANLHRRLGALYWQEGHFAPALAQLALATKIAPQDGETLLSLGLLLRAQGQDEKARSVFSVCVERARETIWAVYAAAAAKGEL